MTVKLNVTPILIIQAGYPPDDIRPLIGDQSDWFREALSAQSEIVKVVCPFLGEELPDPRSFGVAIITGSWAMVTDQEEWSERTASWIRLVMALERPLFGVCYGHQLIAHALGGKVDFHPRGREVGLHTITLSPEAEEDPVLAGLPSEFNALLSHMQTVLVPPAQAISLGRSDHDPHQILRYGPNAFSVQFHPECTPHIISALVKRRAAQLKTEGLDVATLLSRLEPTPHALGILRTFVDQVLSYMDDGDDLLSHEQGHLPNQQPSQDAFKLLV